MSLDETSVCVSSQIKDSIRKMQRGQKLEEELKLREQELETTLSKQKEVNCQSTRVFYVGTVWKFHR